MDHSGRITTERPTRALRPPKEHVGLVPEMKPVHKPVEKPVHMGLEIMGVEAVLDG